MDHHGGHGDHAAPFRDRFWAVLMSLSTIVVALNAQLLRGLDLQRQRRGSP
jgi:hypothetical protein